eukprot:Seg6829.1 transcript_id=Seg6829.1/GoldUCD/mRNA.D3Y31 product="hypothetical protein" protein_id=Seg6829.1/GoldUCD/D3Y31
MVIDDSIDNEQRSIYSSQVELHDNTDQNDIAFFGLDEADLDFDPEAPTDEAVDVPEINVTFTDEQLRYLAENVDPMNEDGNFGINNYLAVLHVLSALTIN